MKVKTKEYEVPKFDVYRIRQKEIFCASSLPFGGNSEQVVDTTQDGYNSWEWSF